MAGSLQTGDRRVRPRLGSRHGTPLASRGVPGERGHLSSTVLFVAGAGGSLRAGVTDNPVLLTRAIKDALVNVTCGGAPAYVWPGGGITLMVDVMRMPAMSFGTVPTPAIVAPIEFTLRLAHYRALGGHMDYVRPLAGVLAEGAWHHDGAPTVRRWIGVPAGNPWPLRAGPMLG